jgi:hypothetical protein
LFSASLPGLVDKVVRHFSPLRMLAKIFFPAQIATHFSVMTFLDEINFRQ